MYNKAEMTQYRIALRPSHHAVRTCSKSQEMGAYITDCHRKLQQPHSNTRLRLVRVSDSTLFTFRQTHV